MCKNMVYNRDNLLNAIKSLNPESFDCMVRCDVPIPSIMNTLTLQAWIDETPINKEYENIIRKAFKDLDSPGFFQFEE